MEFSILGDYKEGDDYLVYTLSFYLLGINSEN
jgi:hypothetical protein